MVNKVAYFSIDIRGARKAHVFLGLDILVNIFYVGDFLCRLDVLINSKQLSLAGVLACENDVLIIQETILEGRDVWPTLNVVHVENFIPYGSDPRRGSQDALGLPKGFLALTRAVGLCFLGQMFDVVVDVA